MENQVNESPTTASLELTCKIAKNGRLAATTSLFSKSPIEIDKNQKKRKRNKKKKKRRNFIACQDVVSAKDMENNTNRELEIRFEDVATIEDGNKNEKSKNGLEDVSFVKEIGKNAWKKSKNSAKYATIAEDGDSNRMLENGSECAAISVLPEAASDHKQRGSELAIVGLADGDAASIKKPNFERIWSKQYEIELLRALIRCGKEQGMDPASAIDSAIEHLQRKLNMPFTRCQVKEKVRRLKYKWTFMNAKFKSTQCRPAKAHDRAILKLSQELWEDSSEAHVSSIPSDQDTHVPPSDQQDPESIVIQMAEETDLNVDENRIILKGFKLIDPARAKELEDMVRAAPFKRSKYCLAGSELKNEVLTMCLESYQRSLHLT